MNGRRPVRFRNPAADLFSSALPDFGTFTLATLLLLFRWNFGDRERYAWSASSPFSFDTFGSGPFLVAPCLPGAALAAVLLRSFALRWTGRMLDVAGS